jgi:LuxR family maltose regulon positive regulatory protein
MSTAVLKTKLYLPPLRRDLLKRPRLVERLDEGLQLGCSVTLLSAAAGWGKTTLLSEWAASRQEAVAWLSLDEDDNDDARFWTYVIAALQTVQPQVGQSSLPLLRGAQAPPARLLLTPLINELAEGKQRTILVLDDYHLITDSSIHEQLAFLLDHLPEQLHLVIASRADPPLPLGRLRASGRLTEVRAGDLRFTAEEAATLLNDVLGLELAAHDVDALEARTEGWAAGLGLAALSMKGRKDRHALVEVFSGSQQFVLEYLIEEVLAQQAQPVQSFLTETSILDRLCGPLCEAVTGDPESVDRLARLERENLFLISLDAEGHWYRYHHLFRDLLRKRLGQALEEQRVVDLHLRASQWLEQAGFLNEAVKHARIAGDLERVASIAEDAAAAGQLDARLTTLLRWVDSLPRSVLRAHPRLQVYRAWGLFMNGHIDRAQRALQDCRRSLQNLPPSAEGEMVRAQLTSLLDTIDKTSQAFFAAFGNHLEEAISLATEAREMALADGHLLLAVEATEALALSRYYQGRLEDSAACCREVIDLASQTPLAAAGHVELAGIHLERYQLDDAARLVNEAIDLSLRVGATQTLNEAYTTASRVHQAQGETEAAWQALAEAADVRSVEGPYAMANFRWAAQKARLQLDAGEADRALEWVERTSALFGDSGATAGERVALPAAFVHTLATIRARALLAQGEPDQALCTLESLLPAYDAAGAQIHVTEICALMALAQELLGKREDALVPLERALKLAAPEGCVRVFASEGARMAPLLREAASRSIEPRHVQRILGLLERAPAAAPAAALAAASLIEQLTPRELDVLRLIAKGSSNKEIAEELVITVNTVKRHCSSIYGKLGVRSRTRAVATARELGLLPGAAAT